MGTIDASRYGMGVDASGNFTMGVEGGKPDVVINAAGVITRPNQPGFDVSLVGDRYINLVNQTTVIFDRVTANIGNHYNPNSGIFTAPVQGFYQFCTSLFINNFYTDLQPGTGLSIILKVAERAYRTICQLGTSQGANSITCGLSNMVYMNASDTARLILKYGIPDNTIPLRLIIATYRDESTSFFSGYLLG